MIISSRASYGGQNRCPDDAAPGRLCAEELGGRAESGRWPTFWVMHVLKIRVKQFAVLAVAAALVSALSGCGGGPAANGPLRSGGLPLGSQCVPGGRPQAFGFVLFTNHGHVTVILDRVVLLHPRNEHLVGSYAVPGDAFLGVDHWPPGDPPEDRRLVHGFRVGPGKTFNMVLGVAAITGGHRATSQGMLVYYHDNSGTYVAKNYTANIIAASTRTC